MKFDLTGGYRTTTRSHAGTAHSSTGHHGKKQSEQASSQGHASPRRVAHTFTGVSKLAVDDSEGLWLGVKKAAMSLSTDYLLIYSTLLDLMAYSGKRSGDDVNILSSRSGSPYVKHRISILSQPIVCLFVNKIFLNKIKMINFSPLYTSSCNNSMLL